MRSERHAAPATRGRGQGLLALAVLLVVVGGGFAFQRGVGVATPPQAVAATSSSGAWFCPHGGGPKEWKATLFLANPGEAPVAARVTSISARKPGNPRDVTVPPQATVSVSVPAKGREASTFVEYFDGWVAASWVTQGGGGEIGVGAEPCASATAPTWYVSDGTTEQGEDAYLVVMNPFAVDAVFDVVLFTPKRAPIRNSALTDHVLRPGKSVAFRLNAFAEGDPAVGAEVEVSLGRVAVSSTGITRDGGIRDVIGSTQAGPQAYLPVGGGAGQSTIDLMVPGEDQVDFGATLLSGGAPVPAGGLTEASQNPTSARPYPVTFSGLSSVDVVAQADGVFAATLRSAGFGNDSGATGGAAEPASDWVVLPAIVGEPARPRIVLVNPGNASLTVTIHALLFEGDTPTADATLTIPGGSVGQVPPVFLEGLHGSAVEIRSSDGDILALAASTSLGVKGLSTYALAMGVAVPNP
ncbi:MAG: DUF5719 family protein [Actinomycetota bacterium]